ncbi:hypothetical protein LCGC14_0586770 [marine sediment metagenome]|uniref:Carboxypeptidase regulatory-like domain-containing protein n=1 Tax=marine sediment metagenome TaxID=412755 RepID=A0A0F9U0W6_9ZZZZ
MVNTTGNYQKISIRIILILMIVFLSTIIPGLFGIFKTQSLEYGNLYDNTLNTNKFTKENYTAISPIKSYGLGNVTIDDINFISNVEGLFNWSISYPLIAEDLDSKALTVQIESYEYINTTKSATKETPLSPKIDTIYSTINETLRITYNNSKAGFLVYRSRFTTAKLIEFYVDNGTSITKLTAETDYTIDHQFFVVFNYEEFFQKMELNFTINFIWEIQFVLGDWLMFQEEIDPFIMEDVEQEFSPKFIYNFFLISWGVSIDLSENIPIDFLEVALTINPPDKDSLTNHEMFVNINDVNIDNYLKTDNSLKIELSDHFRPNRSFIILNFTSTFRLKFEEPVGNMWAIERLVSGRTVRERIYFPLLVAGPQNIYLENVVIYEPGIYYEQVLNTYSLFERDIEFFEANTSMIGKIGLAVKIPYIYVNETCPFSVKYETDHVLRIVITDKIKMPLVGARVEIFFFTMRYGTYVSNQHIQPIDPGLTDENGQIVLNDVPIGNYTVKVYWEGKFVKEASVNTFKETNFVYTSVPHFPIWILVFGIVNVITITVGFMFYRKNKKLR